jgi:carbamoyl-phosphate synthase large subunit
MINILVTESGGPAAIGLIKSIKKSKYEAKIYAVDCNELSAGNLLADEGITVPVASSEEYLLFLLKIVVKYNIDIIIPTGEHDLAKLSWNKDKFKMNGCEIFCSDTFTVQTCQQKHRFYEYLKTKNINLPLSIRGPFIQKPITGSGSRGIKITESRNEMMQEYISGKEYTVDVFCDMNSNIISHVIRERTSIKAGISVIGKVIKNELIKEQVEKVVEELKIKGPSCMQFIITQLGIPYLIECNPRLGGGTYMSTLAGVNCADIYFDLLKNNKPESKEAREITVIRYFEEIIKE